MISFENISKMFSIDLENKRCVEIEFNVIGYPNYQHCWMGKMPDTSDKSKELYWFGLATDGSKSYDYDDYFNFSNSPIFNGKSLKEIWDCIELLSIDGCDPEDAIQFYI